jgi:putative ABC transport system ATP-binding protein
MAPTTVRMVLVEGENADGVTVNQDNFDLTTNGDAPTITAPDQVISAILGTRENAADGGYQLKSTGVTWADPAEAAALRKGLAARKIENVVLVSAFLAAAALAQAVGNATNYARTALLFVESDSATLAVVNTADGSVADVRRRFLPEDDDEAVAELVEMVTGVADMEAHPEGVVVVGSGVDIPLIKPALEAATSLPVSVPEQPKVALARDAAPASANAQLLNATAALEARNLCKSFGSWPTETPILKNIDLRISPGEFVALIGPSGSGKSTLLSILGLLEPPTSGDVLINQKSVARLSRQQLARLRGRAIGYVFQTFNLLAGLSVAENVMLPGLLAGESGRAQYGRAIALLDQFGLAALAKRVPAELSGGEQQRVAIARALFMRPAVILADEPTGNLDTTNGRKVIDALYNLNSAGQTIVLVTHDRSIADEAPRLVSLLDGRIETDSGPIQVSSGVAWRAHN